MADALDLERFVQAQDPVIAQVRRELGEGRKRSHWMWFVFPQLRGLGRSVTAQHYAIGARDEAKAYLAHPVLGRRLVECTALVNAVEGRSAHDIFGSPDDMKFRSSMTLFETVQPDAGVFAEALGRYFGGMPDPRTIALLSNG